MGMQNDTASLEDMWAVLINVNNIHCIAKQSPQYFPPKIQIYVHLKTFTWISIVVLFIQAASWKQAKCPWINKLCYVHTRECYSAIRMPNKKYCRQKTSCEDSRIGRNYTNRKWIGGCQHLELGGLQKAMWDPLGWWRFLYNDSGSDFVTVHICPNSSDWIFKMSKLRCV